VNEDLRIVKSGESKRDREEIERRSREDRKKIARNLEEV